MRSFLAWWRGLPRPGKWALSIGAAFVVFAAIGFLAPSEDDGNGKDASPRAPAEQQPPPPATTQPKAQTLSEQVSALVIDELGDDAPGDRPRIRRVQCAQRACSVHYNANVAVLDAAKETIDDQRWIWQHMFADLNVRQAMLVPWGETTSIGGKKSDSPIMRVTCDRQADAQIDWENVTDDGVKALCTYVPLVNFD